MPHVAISEGTLFSFLLVMARMSGALVFAPFPGVNSAPQPARAALALAFTVALFPRWPAVEAAGFTTMRLAGYAVTEAALGIAIGVTVAVALEAFAFAAQVLGVQAGFGYASTIDPTTEADSSVLTVLAQLIAGLLFFAMGLDRVTLRLFADSLDRVPLGGFVAGPAAAEQLIHAMSSLFSTGLRLALPVTALLIMVDVAMALMGRLNQQLQLLSLAFPAKMLVALAMLSWIAALFPRIMAETGGQALLAARRILGL